MDLLREGEFAHVGDLMVLGGTHLMGGEGHDCKSLAIEGSELYFVARSAGVDENNGAKITLGQPPVRKVNEQNNIIEFSDHLTSLRKGCAVTNRGTMLPSSINHTVRTLKTEPSGADIGPSIT